MEHAQTNTIATRRMTVDVQKHWYRPMNDINLKDMDATGESYFEVPAYMDDATAAACAIGIFHNVVPMICPDDFEFMVLDEEGFEVEQDEDLDISDIADSCKEVWQHHIVRAV